MCVCVLKLSWKGVKNCTDFGRLTHKRVIMGFLNGQADYQITCPVRWLKILVTAFQYVGNLLADR